MYSKERDVRYSELKYVTRDCPGGQVITRATIERRQLQQVERGRDPLTPAQLTEWFVRVPKLRHYQRTERLMARRAIVEPVEVVGSLNR